MIRRLFRFCAFRRRRAAVALAVPALAANPQVEFDTTAGKIRVELYPDAAPKTVANFLDYVKAGHFDGTQFHRVIPGFMIQGGGFTADFKQKPTQAARRRTRPSSRARRAVSTCPARSRWRARSDPNSATAQFFINVTDNKFAQLPLARSRRHRLHGVRQGRRGNGRRRQDRQGAHRRGRTVSRRTFRRRRSSSPRPSSSTRNRTLHGHPAHQPRRHQARARRRERAGDASPISCSTSATAITTTRSSIA